MMVPQGGVETGFGAEKMKTGAFLFSAHGKGRRKKGKGIIQSQKNLMFHGICLGVCVIRIMIFY